MADNIHPIFNTILGTPEKEQLLNQHSIVLWMVGLSGSGKSTLARAIENELFEKGFYTMLLDGDNLRTGVNSNLGFSPEERAENIRRAAEVAKLFAGNGCITICSFISPTHEIRDMAKKVVGDKFVEVYINCPLEVCEERDVKGLYAKARAGEIPEFTGVSAPFEAPESPDIDVDTANLRLEEAKNYLLEEILKRIKKNK